MRNRFQELEDAIQDLVERENPPLLIMAIPDSQGFYLIKAVENRDRQDPANAYLLFTQPSGDSAVAYVDAVVEHLNAQIDLAAIERVAANLPPWPPLPAEVRDSRLAPSARLERALIYARDLIDAPAANKLVCVFCPTEISSPMVFRQALDALLPLQGKAPSAFLSRGKVVIRERETQELISAFHAERNLFAMTYAPDLSPEAVANDLADAAVNPATPEAQRMEALMQLAALDIAHERHAQAIAKYELLYDYYTRYEADQMRAVVLSGVGDVLRRAQSPHKAREKYAQALTLSLAAKALPLIAGTAIQVGDMSFELRELDDAVGHFELAKLAANKLLNRTLLADLEERIGDVQLLKEDLGKAVSAWRRSADIARDLTYGVRQRRAVEKLRATFASARMDAEVRDCEAELAAIPADENAGAHSR